MLDDAAVLLHGAGHVPRHVDERDEGHVEGVAEADEAGGLRGCVDVQQPRKVVGLLRDYADRSAVEPCESDDDVPRVELVHLHEVGVVDHLEDDVHHVVRLIRVVGHDVEQAAIAPFGVVLGLLAGGLLHVVLREEAEESADLVEALLLGLPYELANAALGRVGLCSPQLVVRDDLARGRLHHVGAGDVELSDSPHHHDEVGQGGRVDRSARGGTEHRGYLGHDAGVPDVSLEDGAVPREAVDALLDARAAGVDEADDGRAAVGREVHDLAYLLGDDLGQRAADNGEVLRVDEGHAACDLAVARDDGVAEVLAVSHPELGCAVLDEGIQLLERALVEQQVNALAGGELALGVLCVDAPSASALPRLLAESLKLLAHHVHFAFENHAVELAFPLT